VRARSPFRARLAAWIIAGAVLAQPACAVKLFVPPAEPGVPAPDAGAALDAATAACRPVDALSFAMGMKGRVGDQGIPRGVSFLGAVTRDGRIFLEATALGTQRMVFAGRPDAATLWLREGNRVINEPADDLVEALTGMRLGAPQLLDLLTGCVTEDRRVEQAARVGRRIRVTLPAATVWLEPASPAGWRARWASVGDLRADYHTADGPWPRELTLYTDDPSRMPARLTMTIRTREINPPPSDLSAAFAYTAPRNATRMTLDELRSGAWRRRP
jgi:hypothetical protein